MSKLLKKISKKTFYKNYKTYINEVEKISGKIIKINKNLSGGSDRIFYYIFGEKKNLVFLDYSYLPDEIEYFIKINKFLESIKINVPKIYFIKEKIIIMEYLGNITIYNKYKKIKDEKKIIEIYKKIINELIKMQIQGLKNINKISIVKNKIFNEKSFEWEWQYFKEMYLLYYKKLDKKKVKEIEKIYKENIKKILKIKKVFMHRDFQSQNLHIKKNKIFFIDYQSAHFGPWSYDLASLLEDPYMNLSEAIKEKLLRYYYKKMINFKFFKIDYNNFLEQYKVTAISRLSQASGAYVKLGLIKNKIHFLKYLKYSIPNLKNKISYYFASTFL